MSKRMDGRRQYNTPKKAYDEGKMLNQRIHEDQSGPGFVLCNNSAVSTYITFPSIVKFQPNRSRSYIKLRRLVFKGTLKIERVQADMNMDGPTPGIEGVFSMVVVVDRKPHMSASACLHSFDELFGARINSLGTLTITPSMRDRFYIRHILKRVVSVEKDTAMVELEGFTSLSNKRYSCWSGFKDLDRDTCNGVYDNITKNAVLIYYCWMSDVSSKASSFVSFDLDYIG